MKLCAYHFLGAPLSSIVLWNYCSFNYLLQITTPSVAVTKLLHHLFFSVMLKTCVLKNLRKEFQFHLSYVRGRVLTPTITVLSGHKAWLLFSQWPSLSYIEEEIAVHADMLRSLLQRQRVLSGWLPVGRGPTWAHCQCSGLPVEALLY